MLQGTGSSVGKSLIVAGLCRAFADRGLSPLPFKPQNMSNNAAVTADGGEIGRAQWLQARACRAAPRTDMNPVLLKPQQAGAAQLVVGGRMRGAFGGRDYQAMKPSLMPEVLAAWERLNRDAGIVVVEGAGSASETNLRRGDIANMGFARAALVPVVVVGDIDRGGVIASLVGTRVVLDPGDAALVRGFVVNRMRGDASLFADGMREIARRTGWPALGLVPHLDAAAALPAEDALDLAERMRARAPDAPSGALAPDAPSGALRIAVPLLPHIANFDDLDPLLAEPDRFAVTLAPLHRPLPEGTELVLLPGSKSVPSDLDALFASGWHHDLHAHRRRGGRLFGLCGGLQMLGRSIDDPNGIEGPAGRREGLAMLDIDTVLTAEKRLREVEGRTADGAACRGYEMHLGRTDGPDARARPFARLSDGGTDGAVSADGRVAGSYLHGLFGHPAQRDALAGDAGGADRRARHHDAGVDAALDRVAAHLERHLDLDRLLAIAGARA